MTPPPDDFPRQRYTPRQRAALCGWVVLGWAVGLALAAWMGKG